ncbi:hypothetical protein [Pseudomonas cyclaminis]|uniref:hypothetical protein n=1 Tax=Pseudomonas cyclaminis TaxID=2781239 RepID=UPI00381EE2C2
MSRSTPAFAHRLAQSANDRAYNAALFTYQRTQRHAKTPKPKENFWVRIKNRLWDIWQKVKEYVND